LKLVLRRGPSTVLNIEMPSHPGIVAYEETTLCKMPESPDPDDEDVSPPGPVMDDAAEDPPRSPLRLPESPDVDDVDERGDARPCSPVVSVDISCDSVDCTPAPVDAPAVWAPAAPCAANPARLVVGGAAVTGVTCAVVAAEVAA
jgi:hypothetical protein